MRTRMRNAYKYPVSALAAVMVFGIATASIRAQTTAPYPVRDIRIVQPSAAGGGPDVVARTIATRLSAIWPRRVYVENRPGGSGTVGTMEVARAEKDGYTLLSATFGQAVAPLVLKSATYDLSKDFEPVILIGTTPSVLLAAKSTEFNSIKELVAYAKANPDKVTYATAGLASSGRLAGKAIEHLTNIKMRDITYQGSGPAYSDLIAGRVDIIVDFLTAAVPRVTSGQLKALAITANERSPRLPDVPTLREAGIPDFQIGGWFGLVAPVGTPPDAINTLNAEINRLLKDPVVQKDLASLDIDIRGGSPEVLRAFLVKEVNQWATLVKQVGMQPE
jgi:tripartite-type tricarboxylate transporter receptor subunit TctC